MRILLPIFLVISGLLLFAGCEPSIPVNAVEKNERLLLNPDYTGITIPVNIAPLNFRIKKTAKQYYVRFTGQNGFSFSVGSGSAKINIPQKDWNQLLFENKGKSYAMELFVLSKDNQWIKYLPEVNQIAGEPIDPYLVYRLIEPGYELWNKMGIFQRCLENFDEKPIMLNRMSDNNCMNCHSYCNHDPSVMMLHLRAQHAGTYIVKNEQIKRINTKTGEMISAGVYPSWYPDGSKIAFSTNKTIQFFHALPDKRVEVVDLESDIVIYDITRNEITAPEALNRKDQFETFPNWSPDGKYLYYCSADTKDLAQYDSIRYSLLRIEYNKANNSFGKIDTLLLAGDLQKSVSFPRISPDNKFIVLTLSDYGNFSIWHSSADLYLLNTSDGSCRKMEINSNQPESYHSWSSNGNWLVFSSRRDDGQYTRSYFAHIDSCGKASKPFILPQKDPDFYDSFLKAYNVPELVNGKTEVNPSDFRKATQNKAIQAEFH